MDLIFSIYRSNVILKNLNIAISTKFIFNYQITLQIYNLKLKLDIFQIFRFGWDPSYPVNMNI